VAVGADDARPIMATANSRAARSMKMLLCQKPSP